ncbi:MAG: HNH endonuclease [Clostridium sp.]|uniref:HNH endonuclease signature motif containing protein n=1 Tax=Clostridium sp. TaxID=1506 RepID=UPI0025BA1B8A|nr:HNH endonuclease signature motif containing protein [Clostridium sp.]MCE5220179.1 HNH endonuclease [Clostridium sp.]
MRKLNENIRETDVVKERKCTNCNEWFPETEEYFYMRNKNKPERGFQTECRKCTSKRSYQYKLNNPEWAAIQKEKYRQTESFSISNRKTAQKRREIQKEWQRNNKDKINQYNLERDLHKKHKITKEELDRLYNYANYSCMYCGISELESFRLYHERLHKDHAYNNGSNKIDNCILACKSCNSWKHTKDWDEWYTSDKSIYTQERFDKIQAWLNRDFND